jgi:hypothetical protein
VKNPRKPQAELVPAARRRMSIKPQVDRSSRHFSTSISSTSSSTRSATRPLASNAWGRRVLKGRRVVESRSRLSDLSSLLDHLASRYSSSTMAFGRQMQSVQR